MTNIYTRLFGDRRIPQDRPIDRRQVPNSAGGWSYAVDDWTRLDRFLILGSEGGSYYASERALTIENAAGVRARIDEDGRRLVRRVVEISDSGRAPKAEPAILALAMASKLGDPATRAAARAALPKVCRTGTQLFRYVSFVDALGGWGRGTRRAVADWYTTMAPDRLAYQAIKYQRRDGWSHRDVLRLAHARADDAARRGLLRWIARGELATGDELGSDAGRLVHAFEAVQRATGVDEVAALVRAHRLPREAVPTGWLTEGRVWEALLEDMPLGATIRNLATMTRVGLLTSGSEATARIADRITDSDALRCARIHPIQVLSALMTYRGGQGVRGRGRWAPVGRIVDALDAAFHLAFRHVPSTGRRWLLALDASASMTWNTVAGVPGLTPRQASAALAMVTAAVEPRHEIVAFTSGGWTAGARRHGVAAGIGPVDLTPRLRLDTVVDRIGKLDPGGTDCALPMRYAQAKKLDVDVFVVLTDNETWAGDVHPCRALADYRAARGVDAKLVVVGMVSNGFTIADPEDAGMLDVVGFDAHCPALIADFAGGRAVEA